MCHVSCVTCHVSCVTFHVSHVACHLYLILFFLNTYISFRKNWKNGGASRWRVYYQRGLPRLVHCWAGWFPTQRSSGHLTEPTCPLSRLHYCNLLPCTRLNNGLSMPQKVCFTPFLVKWIYLWIFGTFLVVQFKGRSSNICFMWFIWNIFQHFSSSNEWIICY